jgi:hypothetical protein
MESHAGISAHPFSGQTDFFQPFAGRRMFRQGKHDIPPEAESALIAVASDDGPIPQRVDPVSSGKA